MKAMFFCLLTLMATVASAASPEWIIRSSGGNVSRHEAVKYDQLIRRHAAANGVNPAVIYQIAHIESRFDKKALSNKGAKGLMQIVPKWHQDKIQGRNIYDPAVNIEVGVKIYADYLRQYKTPAKALFAYNGLYGIPGDYSGKVLGVKVAAVEPPTKVTPQRLAQVAKKVTKPVKKEDVTYVAWRPIRQGEKPQRVYERVASGHIVYRWPAQIN